MSLVNDLKKLCEDHKASLRKQVAKADQSRWWKVSGVSNASWILYNQIYAVDSLLIEPVTPESIRFLLTHSEGPQLRARLKTNLWNRFAIWIAGLLVLLTFPFSVPFLAIRSYWIRQTPKFWKSDGAVFADKLFSTSLMMRPSAARKSSENKPLEGASDLTIPSSLIRLSSLDVAKAADDESSPVEEKIHPLMSVMSLMPPPHSEKNAHKVYYLDLRYWAMRFREEHCIELGLCVDFRYEDRDLEKITVAFPTHFIPQRNAEQREEKEDAGLPHPGIAEVMIGGLWGQFFGTAPTFHGILQSAKATHNDYHRKNLYKQALQLAKNKKQMVVVLEALLNDSYKALERCMLEECKRGGETTTNMQRDKKRYLENINDYIAQLPENYRALTPTTQEVENYVQGIFDQLQKNQIGPAYLSYRKMPVLSPFVQNHIPHLVVMRLILNAFFCLSNTEGYELLPHYHGEPKDEELRKKTLLVYLHHGAIWYGTKMSSGEIKRVFIPDCALGTEANKIRTSLGSGAEDLTYDQENLLFDVFAKNSFYPKHFSDIVHALDLFNQAASLLEAQAGDHQQAIFLRQQAIRPLQELINSSGPINRAFLEKRVQERRAAIFNHSADLYLAPQCSWETFEQMKDQREQQGLFSRVPS